MPAFNVVYGIVVGSAGGDDHLTHCCYTVVKLSLHCCDTVVTLLLHCCYTVVTLLLHRCYTVVRFVGSAGGHNKLDQTQEIGCRESTRDSREQTADRGQERADKRGRRQEVGCCESTRKLFVPSQ
jgi:hypothetical protein